MKHLALLLVAVTAFAANGQSTNPPTGKPVLAKPVVAPSAEHLLNLATNTINAAAVPNAVPQVSELDLSEVALHLKTYEPRAYEVKWGKLALSGIAVEAAKARNPLQLLNPAAPAQYGSPEDGVVRNPTTGRVSGLKLFCLAF